eukprot:3401949-Amphidinium_carterae.1
MSGGGPSQSSLSQRLGISADCPLCHAADCTWEHAVWCCPATPNTEEATAQHAAFMRLHSPRSCMERWVLNSDMVQLASRGEKAVEWYSRVLALAVQRKEAWREAVAAIDTTVDPLDAELLPPPPRPNERHSQVQRVKLNRKTSVGPNVPAPMAPAALSDTARAAGFEEHDWHYHSTNRRTRYLRCAKCHRVTAPAGPRLALDRR